MASDVKLRLSWLSITPLAGPVVPDWNKINLLVLGAVLVNKNSHKNGFSK